MTPQQIKDEVEKRNKMTNKIPQEIEEKILKGLGYRFGINKREEDFCLLCIREGFKAGQKQEREDAFKEMIKNIPNEFLMEIETSREAERFKEELLSQLNSKEEKQDDA